MTHFSSILIGQRLKVNNSSPSKQPVTRKKIKPMISIQMIHFETKNEKVFELNDQ